MRVPGLAGPIDVRMVESLEQGEGGELIGQWRPMDRCIYITQKAGVAMQETALWHEWLHAVMFDGGSQDLPKKTQERVCDLVASALSGAGLTLPRLKGKNR